MEKKAAVRVIAENRKARFQYDLMERIEAGLVLAGTEVKAMREGRVSLGESYVSLEKGEAWLINAHVPPFSAGNRHNHAPRRHRKLLLNGREIRKVAGAVSRQGLTVIPTRLYFNPRGRAKLEIALARGRKMHDKRQVAKDRDWGRRRAQLLRNQVRGLK